MSFDTRRDWWSSGEGDEMGFGYGEWMKYCGGEGHLLAVVVHCNGSGCKCKIRCRESQ